jgi:tRNA pseudouridine38-40 synthase
MRYFKLTLEYDGTEFAGWQVQPNRRTVQGELYDVIRDLSSGEVKVTGAGRTDAGAHAVGQVASVVMDTNYNTDVLWRAIGAKLPPDIMLKDIGEVNASFNARYDAISKTYRYIFKRGGTALWRRRFYGVSPGVDVDRMRKVARRLIGEKDFIAFSTATGDDGGSVCRVMKSEIREIFPLIIFEITADRFLYNMVRRISGTLLWIGEGKEVDIDKILESRNRSMTSNILPAYALYLMGVNYLP